MARKPRQALVPKLDIADRHGNALLTMKWKAFFTGKVPCLYRLTPIGKPWQTAPVMDVMVDCWRW